MAPKKEKDEESASDGGADALAEAESEAGGSDALDAAAKADEDEALDFEDHDEEQPPAEVKAPAASAGTPAEPETPAAHAAPATAELAHAAQDAHQRAVSEGSRERSPSQEEGRQDPRLPEEEDDSVGEAVAGGGDDWGMLSVTFDDDDAPSTSDFTLSSVEVDDALRRHASAVKSLSGYRTEDVSQASDRVGPLHGYPPSIFFSSRSIALVEAERSTEVLKQLGLRFGEKVLYYGDVGGGPGAWVEALLWINAQGGTVPMRAALGVGMSAKGRDDWQMDALKRTSGNTLGEFAFYGADGSGEPSVSNVRSFAASVRKRTSGIGLHFLSGGGEGSGYKPRSAKAMLVARVLSALITLQEGGSAMFTIPNITSEFVADILYILWYSFDNLTCVTPRVSRPSAVPTCVVVCEDKRGAPSFQGPRFAPGEDEGVVNFLYRLLATLHKNSGCGEAVTIVDRTTLVKDQEFKEWYTSAVTKTLRWRTTTLSRAEAALERAAGAEGGRSGRGMRDDRTPQEKQDQLNAARAFLTDLDLPASRLTLGQQQNVMFGARNWMAGGLAPVGMWGGAGGGSMGAGFTPVVPMPALGGQGPLVFMKRTLGSPSAPPAKYPRI
eukprot:Hpha_TRINITY_DN34025_c0_g1::TRINITY_DN34025_c0_g1_i1::g.30630::m.30630/K14589/CMTR1, FTSJD2, MTR1; cap1 methyltransferase